MENGQVTQENAHAHVEDASDKQHDFELEEHDGAVQATVRLFDFRRLDVEVVKHGNVGQDVHQAHQKGQDDQLEEVIVVCFADAIIEPATVMVEVVDAPVARAAMLSSICDTSLTDLAFVLVSCLVELLAKIGKERQSQHETQFENVVIAYPFASAII